MQLWTPHRIVVDALVRPRVRIVQLSGRVPQQHVAVKVATPSFSHLVAAPTFDFGG